MPIPFTLQQIELPEGSMQLRIRGRLGSAGGAHVLHLHGGGFNGRIENGEAVAAMLQDSGATVISADIPGGPDHPFPAGLDAAYAALVWLNAKGRRKAIRLFVAGEDFGGNLAAALALMCRDRNGPELAGQILLSPMLDPLLATCSVRAAKAGSPGCWLAQSWTSYLGTPDRACHPYAAPANASRLAGLAPALILTGQHDPMQDEAFAYAKRLQASFVPVQTHLVQDPGPWPSAWTCAAITPPAWAAEASSVVASFLSTTALATTQRPGSSPRPIQGLS